MITISILSIIALALIVLFSMGAQFNTAYIPSPIDELTRMEDLAERDADFNGTTFDMGEGFAAGGPGLAGSVVIRTAELEAGTYEFIIEEGATDAGPWTQVTHEVAVTAAGTIGIPCFVSSRFLRCRLDLDGEDAAITYESWFVAHHK